MKSFIFVVGPPASGKSTLIKSALKDLPKAVHVDDFAVLRELDEICRQKQSGPSKTLPVRTFWPEISPSITLDTYPISALRPLTHGGFDITDPRLWDDILERACSIGREGNMLFLEFSRGDDPQYCALHKIQSSNVYLTSISILLRRCPWISNYAISVIAINCDPKIRNQRNEARKNTGRHSVAESVMQTVYKESCLNQITETKHITISVETGALKIPVVSISTNSDLAAAKRSFRNALIKVL
jgi:predicted ABC-type ATPase